MAAAAGSPAWDEGEPSLVVWREGGRMVVSLRGEQDLSTAAHVGQALAAASAAGSGDVVVDLSEVVFLDAAIITELARGRRALRLQSRALMLRDPTPFARRLLEVCGLVGFIEPVPAAVARPTAASRRTRVQCLRPPGRTG